MTLGLRTGVVKVVPHDDSWAEAYEASRCELWCVGRRWITDVQHVGSTAVEGLDAKPIIDIAVGVSSDADQAALVAALEAHGWIDRGDQHDEGGYLLVKEIAPDVRTHHLHVVEHDGAQWENYLTFRRLLTQDPSLRANYTALKHELQQRFPNDRPAYTAGKAAFVRRAIDRR